MEGICVAPHGVCPIDGTVRGAEQSLKVHDLRARGALIRKGAKVEVLEIAKVVVYGLEGSNAKMMGLVLLSTGLWYPERAFRLTV